MNNRYTDIKEMEGQKQTLKFHELATAEADATPALGEVEGKAEIIEVESWRRGPVALGL